MRPLTALAGLLWASASVGEAVNASRKFYLRTQVKPNQDGKKRFDDLWLYAYHTGAGTNDAVLSKNKTHAVAGFLSDSDITTPDGDPLYGVKFDLDSSTGNITWGLEPEISVNIYAAWQPVRVDVGVEPDEYSAFFVNETGLQWTTSTTGIPDSFGGWYVCEWWHGDIDGPSPAPQLFFRVNGFGHITLETCADVVLVPEYLEES